METNSNAITHFATTVQKAVTKATIIDPRTEVRDASVEYCVSSGYVLITDTSKKRAFVTHISNVVLELSAEELA
jgi:hypothetical protein